MPHSPSRKTLVVVAALVLVSGFGWLTYSRLAEMKAAASAGGPKGGMAMPVEAALATAETLVETNTSVGTLVVQDGVVLRPEISGIVTDILFKDGDKVSKGTPLFQLDDSVYKAQLAQAEAQLALAKQTDARADSLSKRGAATEQTRDEAAASLRTATASVALAKANLEKTVISAPFDGVVGIRQVSVGGFVSPGQNLVTLQGLDTMRVDFRIPETQLSRLSVGQKVTVETPAFPGSVFEGQLSAIDPLADSAGRSVAVRATLPNPEGKLRPGLYAMVKVVLSETPNTIFIPASALWPMGDKVFVYKITDGKALIQPITVLSRDANRVAVASGLQAGDQVATSGQVKLAMAPPTVPVPVMVVGDPNAASQPPQAAPEKAEPEAKKEEAPAK